MAVPKGPRTQMIRSFWGGYRGIREGRKDPNDGVLGPKYKWYFGPKTLLFGSLDPGHAHFQDVIVCTEDRHPDGVLTRHLEISWGFLTPRMPC